MLAEHTEALIRQSHLSLARICTALRAGDVARFNQRRQSLRQRVHLLQAKRLSDGGVGRRVVGLERQEGQDHPPQRHWRRDEPFLLARMKDRS
jgi:hypothetical protein